MKRSTGFTLIELMIVVAIIAILAAIALPAYQDYVIRSQVSEGLVLASGAKTALTDAHASTGNWPTDNASAGLALPTDINGKFVTSVNAGVAPGTIEVTFGNKVNAAIVGQTITLSGFTDATSGSVVWTCRSATITTKYLPTSCRP